MKLDLFGNWRLAAGRLAAMSEPTEFVRQQLERSQMTAVEAGSTSDSWHRLKPLVKADFMADQQLAPPFGTRRAVPVRDIRLLLESSGSMNEGRETHYMTGPDMARLAQAWASCFARMGISDEDIVAFTIPIGMAGGGARHLAAYQTLGAKMLRMANLSAPAKIDAMRYYGATVLVATPSYVDRLAAVATEHGIEPASLRVRHILVSTQSLTVEWITRAEARWQARVYEWYGSSAGFFAFSCETGMADPSTHRRGALHWDPDILLQEVVNPETGDLVPGDERGELIGTPLLSDAEPYFRYATRDEVRFVAPGTCPCGSDRPGIESGTVRRLDQMFKIKGVNVWPARVEMSVFAHASVHDYRARVRQDDSAREIVEIEVLAPEADGRLAAELSDRLREDTGIGFQVSVVRSETDWSQETAGEAGKVKRWVDLRGT